MFEGDPATEIVRFAHNERFSLILLPTRGLGVFRRLLLGSVTAKVLHDADCPVWTGLHPETVTDDGVVSVRRVACAVDLGPQTNSALNWAWSFAQHWKAPLHVIHVLPPADDTGWHGRLSSMAHQELTAKQTELGIDARIHLEFGSPASTATEAAKRLGADLLVIGRGHAGSGPRLGGTAYAMVRDAPCPVVSV